MKVLGQFALLNCMLVIMCCPALGQTKTGLRVHVAVEGARPMGPTTFIERWNVGWGLDGSVGLRMPFRKELEVGIAFGYTQHGLAQEDLIEELGLSPSTTEVDGGALSVVRLALRAKYNFEEGARFQPFVLGEAGIHRTTLDDFTITNTNGTARDEGVQELVPSFGFGGGLHLPLTSNLSALFEATYVVSLSTDLFRNRNGDSDLLYRLPIRLGFAWQW